MSNGMMGSERELNLGSDHTVVMRLPKDAPVGEACQVLWTRRYGYRYRK